MSDEQPQLVIFQEVGQPVEVHLDTGRDTVWLSQRQMAEVFDTTPENVLMHLKNIYRDGELDEQATAKDFLAVRREGTRQVRRTIKHYDLDAIISVGYRISSKRAVAFRQWATRTLREHLTQGYTLNRQRLEANARELEAALLLVKKAAQSPELLADTGRGLVDIVTRYAQTFLLLQRYDEGLLAEPREQRGRVLPTVAEARAALARLKADLMARGKATNLLPESGTKPLPPCSATWTRPCLANRLTRAWRPRRRTCCISSSRTIRSRTATSTAAPFCSWISSTATAVCWMGPASR